MKIVTATHAKHVSERIKAHSVSEREWAYDCSGSPRYGKGLVWVFAPGTRRQGLIKQVSDEPALFTWTIIGDRDGGRVRADRVRGGTFRSDDIDKLDSILDSMGSLG